jgi:integrase
VSLDQLPHAFGKGAARRGFKLHNLRHAHLSKLANSGISIAAVLKRAGHADIRTSLATYVHADASDDDVAAEVIAGLMR